MKDQVEFVENLYRKFEDTEAHDKVRFAAWCLHRAATLPVVAGVNTDELERLAHLLWDGDDPLADAPTGDEAPATIVALSKDDEDAAAIADELSQSVEDAREALKDNSAEATARCAEHNLPILTFATYPHHEKVVEKEMADVTSAADKIIGAEAMSIDYLAPATATTPATDTMPATDAGDPNEQDSELGHSDRKEEKH